MATVTVTPEQIENTLRRFIASHIDYDIHKNLAHNEATGKDSYGELADIFFEMLEAESA